MKVKAALWFETPCASVETRAYPSMKAVIEDFTAMCESYTQYGGGKPVGAVYDYDKTDYPICILDIGPRGGVVVNRAV